MKKMTMVEKGKLLVEVMESDLTPKEKAKKLEFLKMIMKWRVFLKMTFHDIYIAVLDHLGIEKYTGDKYLIKRLSEML